MPPCGTFDYSGVVPAQERSRWELADQSGAGTISDEAGELVRNRLVGLRPLLRVVGGRILLEAVSRERAEVASVWFELDAKLVELYEGGDLLNLRRTASADIGLSLLRGRELIVAVGAVTVVPLGDVPDSWRRSDTWREPHVGSSPARDEDTEPARRFSVTVVRAIEDGIPGHLECLAISRSGACPHDAAVRSAELLARPGGGLTLKRWD